MVVFYLENQIKLKRGMFILLIEFHGNTASDNRIDSPDSKVNSQNAASHTEKYIDKVYTDKELLPLVPPFSPPGYHTHVFDSKYYSVVDV